MKVTVELELNLMGLTDLTDTELKVELYQDMERALSLAPVSTVVYAAAVLEVHLENKD